MKPEEIVGALRTYPTKKLQSVALDAADLIERQAKAMEEVEKALKETLAISAGSYDTRIRRALADIRAARGEKEDG